MDWSDEIVVINLNDEPALSDELAGVIDRLRHRAGSDGSAGKPPADGVPHVVLDFSQVSYMASSNIAQLLSLRTVVENAGRRLMLCALSDDVWSVLLVTGLDKIFNFAPDPMTALAGLQIDKA